MSRDGVPVLHHNINVLHIFLLQKWFKNTKQSEQQKHSPISRKGVPHIQKEPHSESAIYGVDDYQNMTIYSHDNISTALCAMVNEPDCPKKQLHDKMNQITYLGKKRSPNESNTGLL